MNFSDYLKTYVLDTSEPESLRLENVAANFWDAASTHRTKEIIEMLGTVEEASSLKYEHLLDAYMDLLKSITEVKKKYL